MASKKKWKKGMLYLAAVAGLLVLCYFFLLPAVNFIAGIYNRNHRANLVKSKQGRPSRNYFIRVDGNDANDGRTMATAWKSINKLNEVEFNPGDSILLQSGQQFTGNVVLDEKDFGTKEKPIYFGGCGNGSATLNANNGSAITATDGEFQHFSKLILKGSGAETSQGNGLAVTNNMRGDIRLSNIWIDSVDASGFRWNGIVVEGKKTKSGFDSVFVQSCAVHDNGDAGLYIKGKFNFFDKESPKYAHFNVVVENVKAFNNWGLRESKVNTGSGIVLSDVNRGLIEKCVSYNNGAHCLSKIGGPVGIWAWDAKDVVIQNNESFNNKTGGIYDGGGFDLDGGCVNCVLQYNYSHDNQGSGFFLAQFYWARKHSGNIIRYNVSENDGRKNGYAGLDVWGEVEDGYLYNNTVVMNAAPSDTCSAVLFRPNFEMGWEKMRFPKHVVVANNVFVVSGNVNLVRTKFGVEDVKLVNNNYFSSTSTPFFDWNGKRYALLEPWSLATKQERRGGQLTAWMTDPHFISPLVSTGNNKALRFQLASNSPLIDQALNVQSAFKLRPVTTDLIGTSLPQGAGYDLGAFEVPQSSQKIVLR